MVLGSMGSVWDGIVAAGVLRERERERESPSGVSHVPRRRSRLRSLEAGGHGRMEAGTIARLQCGASGALLREGWSLAPYESSQQSDV